MVALSARRDGSRLVLEIKNTCGAAAAPATAGPVTFTPRVGLNNTRTRLDALYGADFRFETRRTIDGSIVVEIALPWKRSAA
jgi:LytS/YehU family sensor histidine kinase